MYNIIIFIYIANFLFLSLFILCEVALSSSEINFVIALKIRTYARSTVNEVE